MYLLTYKKRFWTSCGWSEVKSAGRKYSYSDALAIRDDMRADGIPCSVKWKGDC